MQTEIKIFIADDHPVFLRGLSQTIEAADVDLKVIGNATDGEAAFDKIKELSPDVAILDVSMPKMNGFELARKIREEGLSVRFIFLTMYKDEEMFNEALDIGAKGYVLKTSALDDIVSSIKTVAADEYFISPSLTKFLINRHEKSATLEKQKPGIKDLTPSELQIIKLIAESKTSKEIAEELFISYRTVENHRSNICTKLGLQGSNSLIKFAFENKSKLM
jgi:DNA-binding NarL/FixJ family response regulator